MQWINEIPEIAALTTGAGLIRIPPQQDIPLTARVRGLIDTAEFQRLKHISQLGLVALVYPAANHTRFEHALGVYRLALLVLQRLAHDERFREAIGPRDAEHLLVASLLHDLGHWPFCHPIEDIDLPGVPRHEMYANSFLLEGEIADVLRDEWGIQPRDIVSLLSEKPREPATKILQSILSGPIDIDKMDYLDRDSLHAGVPYGRHFDQGRLIHSLCLNQAGDGLAITEKGKTAAEMMVFARYVMFSEVYWHHAVRAATAMLQRAFYDLHGMLELETLFRLTEQQMISELQQAAAGTGAEELLSGLFGPTRRLYKRLAQYSFLEQPEIYARLARRPYPWLAACGELFVQRLSTRLGRVVAPHEVLFDAPPVEREVEFKVDVYYLKQRRYRPLEEVSPVVRTLAREQFDDYVKRVRIFVHPRLHEELSDLDEVTDMLSAAIDQTDA